MGVKVECNAMQNSMESVKWPWWGLIVVGDACHLLWIEISRVEELGHQSSHGAFYLQIVLPAVGSGIRALSRIIIQGKERLYPVTHRNRCKVPQGLRKFRGGEGRMGEPEGSRSLQENTAHWDSWELEHMREPIRV